jgi:hypothetical protein
MISSLSFLRSSQMTACGAGLWLVSEQTASAQTLLAQTGGGKTAVGWVIVLLCIALGLLVVCRPSGREKPEGGKK